MGKDGDIDRERGIRVAVVVQLPLKQRASHKKLNKEREGDRGAQRTNGK